MKEYRQTDRQAEKGTYHHFLSVQNRETGKDRRINRNRNEDRQTEAERDVNIDKNKLLYLQLTHIQVKGSKKRQETGKKSLRCNFSKRYTKRPNTRQKENTNTRVGLLKKAKKRDPKMRQKKQKETERDRQGCTSS